MPRFLPTRRLVTFTIFIILASLDNAAAGVLPPLYALIARSFGTSDAALGMVTAVYAAVVALAAVTWGYWGDRGRRRQILFAGTLIWGAGMILSGMATRFSQLLLWQTVTALGVGSISSVGFSVISDIIPAHRRGLALSMWSISQTLGGAFGALLAGTLGAYNWRWPFFLIAGLGLLFAFLYLLTPEPRRGEAEPELAPLFAAGKRYKPRIQPRHIPALLKNRSNAWLLWQSFFIALAYGSTIWIPRWAIARVEAEGYSLETATIAGNLIVTLFGLGLFFAIPAGHLGDRWQRRRADGRLLLAAGGLAASIPFFAGLYLIPLSGLSIPAGASLWATIWAVLLMTFGSGLGFLTLTVAVIGLALYAFDGPNWAALITSVNLPEHRGTVIGLSRLFRAAGNALSIALAGLIFTWLEPIAPPPLNYSVGLASFQVLVIPAILCYLLARRAIPADLARVRETLRRVGKTADSTRE